jgi:hypothetical protein
LEHVISQNGPEPARAGRSSPGQWEAALISIVQELFAQGVTKQQLYDAFLNEHLRIRMELREADEELIADVILDGLSGFCGASDRLFPEEPDAR